jgi:mannose-6-phosphate isomerase
MCVEGEVDITAGFYTETLRTGETVLLPAITEEIAFNSNNAKLLEVYIDKASEKRVQKAS